MKLCKIAIGVVLGFLLYTSINHEIECYNLDGVKWGGVVTGKAVSGGESSYHYLRINDVKYGIHTIPVHPITYNDYSVGDVYIGRFIYTPFIGLQGAAYRPSPFNSSVYEFAAVFCKVIIALTLICAVILLLIPLIDGEAPA